MYSMGYPLYLIQLAIDTIYSHCYQSQLQQVLALLLGLDQNINLSCCHQITGIKKPNLLSWAYDVAVILRIYDHRYKL